jgi:hypothetical protein
MSQLYVGKHPISKGIGTAIRRFVVLSFAPAVSIGPDRRRVRVQIAGTVLECCKQALSTGGCGLEQFRSGEPRPIAAAEAAIELANFLQNDLILVLRETGTLSK